MAAEVERRDFRRRCRTDLHWLLVHGLHRPDCDNEWVKARCAEVQASPDGHLDLWAREHYKSTIITFAKTIQDILVDPEVTIGIFSHTRPIAKAFLRQIKQEFETNDTLKGWFPDILWENPQKQSPKWSEDEGIVVKRKDTSKEQVRGGIIIPDTAKEKPQEAEVIAVGEGKFNEAGNRMKLDVKKGDTVLIGKYSGTEIKIDDVEYTILREDEVLAIVEG